jgi:hypothetical protein
MFCVFRPSFEVVREGRILNLVSGDRRFSVQLFISSDSGQKSSSSRPDGTTRNRLLQPVFLFWTGSF